jgi:hypothetical protein
MGNRVESTAEARIRAVLTGVADPEIRIVFIERYQSSNATNPLLKSS